ncbi:hypothetical protein TH61_04640 [Rufibacter sp. DG15C]|uniref:ice-binding family protein n=1 Tax=Rufibacter sp. DG15C TaxID=1379909 RepID=UPI00078DAADC|nr:ice-binding family protein [Rufibacter sp. DG15C]AMM50604.1 hypothetical protein TH61_04640 [Rufibacter sp. DG15C]
MKKILHLIAALFAISISTNAQTQNAPGLGAAQEFAVLASGSVVNTGSTLVYADLGTSPGNVILGFPPGIVLGEIRPGGVEPAAAQVDARKAYDFLATLTPTSNMTGQQLGKGFSRTPEAVAGTVLGPGVYRFDGDARLKGQLRLDGKGNPNAVFVIQVNGDLIVDEGSVISVQNGAQPKNIFFRVTGNVVVGNQGLVGTSSALKGNVLVQNNITLSNGTTHEGRLLSLGGNVVLNNNTVFLPLIVETDLAITKTADRSEVAVGDTITYTITVRNQGPDDATGVQVVETLPSSLAFIDYTSFRDNVPATFAYNATTSTFTIGNLAFGETATIKLRVRVLSSGNLVNRVRVIGNEPDPDKDDDEDEEPVVVPGVVTDLQTIKTVDKTRANVGDALTYTIVARNNGPNAATGVIIRDVLPIGQINITGQTSTNGTNLDITTGVWTIGNLASGQSVTLTINATITGTGTIVNTAIIRGNQADQQPANNTSTVVTVVTPGVGPGAMADLQVQKTVNKTRASVGDALVYTVTARNLGPDNATGVTVRDVLPLSQIDLVGNVTVSTGTYNATTGIWTIGNLAVGQTATLTVNSTIKANGVIVNTAVISGDQLDERPESNTSTVITVVGAGPEVPTVFTDLQVVKTVDKTRANIGDALVYNVTVRNNGPNNATNVFVVDVLPTNQLDIVGQVTVSVGTYNAATGVWTIGALANGQTATLRVNATIKTAGTIVNTAIVRGNEADQQPVNNTSTVITIVGETPGPGTSTDLEAIKTVNRTRASVGDALTYTVTARNNGPNAATGVIIRDVLPLAQINVVGTITPSAGTYNATTGIWTIGNLAAGQSVTMTVNATIKATGTIVNTAIISGNEPDLQPANNTATVVTVVGDGTGNPTTSADLQVVKAVDKTRANVGDALRYTITARNLGPNTATGVKITDVLPVAQIDLVGAVTVSTGTYNATTGIWTIGNLGVGQTETMTVNATIKTTGTIINTAIISGDQVDERPESNTSTVITIVGGGTGNPTEATDLEVVKAVDKTRANVGDALRYDVTIKNNGPSSATGVLVVDVLPLGQLTLVGTPTVSKGTYNVANGVWTVGNLASGETATFTVNSTITTAGTIVNTATIRGNEADQTPGNNSSTVITVVGATGAGVANLGISKSVDKGDVTLGEQVVFTLRATNAGPSDATGVKVTDVLPAGLDYVSASTSVGTVAFNEANRTITWSIGNIARNQADVVLTITAKTSLVGKLRNVAVIDGDQVDPDEDDDDDDAEVCVRPLAPIVNNPTACVGGNATFTFTATGTTQYEVTGLPGVTNPVTVTGGAYTVSIATLSAGSYTITFKAIGSCASSLPSTATLTVSALPGKLGQITASSPTLCVNVAIRYSVTPVTGATSYIWTVPAGWRLTGTTTGNGPFTTTAPEIELIPSTTKGEITVKASNNCGTSEASILAVEPGATPATPVIINESGPCTDLIYRVAGVTGETYTWTVSGDIKFKGTTATSVEGTTVTLEGTSADAKTGTLTVTATNGGACGNAVASVTVDATAPGSLFIPNVFTPNGDGVNDFWVIRNLEKFPDNDLAIYNRWGNEVFKTRGYNNTWQAAGLEEATYFYVLRVRGCNGDEQVYRGPVQVVR